MRMRLRRSLSSRLYRPLCKSTRSASSSAAKRAWLSLMPLKKPISMNMITTEKAMPSVERANRPLRCVSMHQATGMRWVSCMSEQVGRVGALHLLEREQAGDGGHGHRQAEHGESQRPGHEHGNVAGPVDEPERDQAEHEGRAVAHRGEDQRLLDAHAVDIKIGEA